MASIFRPSYWHVDKKSGKKSRRKYKTWYIKYRDENGLRKTVPGYCDKEATRQKAAQLERRVARIKAGLVDPFEKHVTSPIGEHLEAFKEHLKGKGDSDDHIHRTHCRAKAVIDGCGFHNIVEIDASDVEQYLTKRRENGDFGPQTSNYYLTAVKSFCRWLVKNRRAPHDPLVHLGMINTEGQNSRPRRVVSEGEFARIIQEAHSSESCAGLSGPDRAMVYMLATYTGYRAQELASLTPASFDLESGTVTVEAAYSKRRRQDVQPLRLDLVAALKAYMSDREPNQPLWPGKWYRKAAGMLRVDLEAAQVPYRDDRGRVFDFHAFRHSYITNLYRSGTYGKLLQVMARHSTPVLTARYTHVELADVQAALNAMPTLPSLDKPSQNQQKRSG